MDFVNIIKNDSFLLEKVKKINPALLETPRRKKVSKCEAVKHFWNSLEGPSFRNYLAKNYGFNTRMSGQIKDAIVVLLLEHE